jgi:hypothetical protein
MAYDLKDYKEVSERIIDLRMKYPDASLASEVILWPTKELPFIAVKALCYRTRKDENPGVGLAWEPFPGKTPYTRDSELQNAETSAWGRAIVAALASDTKQGVASADEVRNRRNSEPSRTPGSDDGAGATQEPPPASAPSPNVEAPSAIGTTAGEESVTAPRKPRAASPAASTPSSEADEANTATPSAPTSTSAPDTAEEPGSDGEAGLGSEAVRLFGGKAHVLRASRMFHDFATFEDIDEDTLTLLIEKKKLAVPA